MFIDWLIDPSFQGVNRFFSLSFWDNADRTGHNIFSSNYRNERLQCYDGRNFFDQPVKNELRTYGNIYKIITC